MSADKARPASRRPRAAQAVNPPGPVFERNLSYRLSMLHFLLGRSIAEIYAAEQLTMHQWKVMSVVCQFAPLPATEVQGWVTLDKSAISRAVRRLVEQGLLERKLHGSDGRAIDLVPTRHGKTVNARVVRKIAALQESVLGSLPSRSVETLFECFDQLERELRGRDAQHSAPIWD